MAIPSIAGFECSPGTAYLSFGDTFDAAFECSPATAYPSLVIPSMPVFFCSPKPRESFNSGGNADRLPRNIRLMRSLITSNICDVTGEGNISDIFSNKKSLKSVLGAHDFSIILSACDREFIKVSSATRTCPGK